MARTLRNVEVLLLQDSESLGEVGDVVTVRPGYARNYLFPSGIACPVTKDALQRVERAKEQASLQRARRAAKVAELAKGLEGLSLTIEERASEEGHLFGSVSAATIQEALAAQGIRVEEKQIQLEAHIKELGIFNVPIRLDPENTVALRIWVVEPEI
jgi:large subunit ribosomal protein L9